jgi:hypothetical protein
MLFRGTPMPANARVSPIVPRASYGQLTPRIGRSPAPNRWATTTAPSTDFWEDMVWAPELSIWVAVGSNSAGTSGRIAYSRDGRRWTVVTVDSGVTCMWCGVTWSPLLRRFVAVSDRGTSRAATSPDGINWTVNSGIGTRTFRRVVWSPKRRIFVACAYSGVNRIAWSADGFTWNPASLDTNQWFALEWCEGVDKFIAIGDTTGSDQVATSVDGANWVTSAASAAVRWLGIAHSPRLGVTVVTAQDAARVMVSRNGKDWVTRNLPSNSSWYRVKWIDEIGRFVAMSSSSKVMTSVNGYYWEEFPLPNSQAWVAFGWSPKLRQLIAFPENTTGLGVTCRL